MKWYTMASQPDCDVDLELGEFKTREEADRHRNRWVESGEYTDGQVYLILD